MVSEKYKPSMTPVLEPARVVRGTEVPARIRISGPYLDSLRNELTHDDLAWLLLNMEAASICPEQYWYMDTARTRELLKAES